MKTVLLVIQLVIIAFTPLVASQLAKKYKAIRFVGPIILCYVTGIVISNIPGLEFDRGIFMTVSEISVPIAIPLVLMCTNLIEWFKLAKKTVIAFVLLIIAALVSSLIAVLIFSNSLPIGWQLSGMLIGCYTGGTPNLMAIGMALNVDPKTLVLINASDMLAGGVYFLFLTSIGIRIYRRFLPKFEIGAEHEDTVGPFMEPVFKHGTKQGLKNIGLTVSLAILATGVTAGIVMLIFGSLATVPMLLGVSLIGIGLSFVKKLHKIDGVWQIGQYVILMFSVALGGTVDVMEFFNSSGVILLYTMTVMFGAILLHFFLCKIFKVDSDTALITSTAGVYGPAFIAPVANAMNNQKVVVSGLITGLAGYAVGNFLGIGLAYILKLI